MNLKKKQLKKENLGRVDSIIDGELYEKIAEILDSTYSSIYRSIRYSLDVAYWQGRLKNKSIGEYKFIEPQTKPTPFEFMNMIREQISTKMNRCFVAKSKALKGGDVIG